MYQVTAKAPLCVIHWDPSHPYQLTSLAVSGDRTDSSERVAASALTGASGLTSWLDLPASARQSLVRACRRIPTLGMYCVIDDEQVEGRDEFLRCAIQDTVEQFLQRFHGWNDIHVALGQPSMAFRDTVETELQTAGIKPHFADNSLFPGLRDLIRLTALACRETEYRVDIPEDEDLLEIYDTYQVGSPYPSDEPW